MVSNLKYQFEDVPMPEMQPACPQLMDYNLSDSSECLTYMFRVLAHSHKLESCHEGVKQFLEAGLRRYGMSEALVVRGVSAQIYEVLACSGRSNEYYIGQHLPLGESLCSSVLTEGVVSAFDADLTGFQVGVVSELSSQGDFIGAAIRPQFAEPSILCFIRASETQESESIDENFIALLAEGVACMTDQQKTQAQRKLSDHASLASGHAKTLDDYLEKAKLPEVFGVPARVVEVLQKRIGESSLSIGNIAEELNLSKRTLQRRLQQQDVSFAELRDQVRFHYSIDYLVKQHLSIDSISASLDFSDRTSFTNAFKRWTGLSPSTFRKFFRDYV